MTNGRSRSILMAMVVAGISAISTSANAGLIYLDGSLLERANFDPQGNPSASASYPGPQLFPILPVSFGSSLTSPDGLATASQTFNVSKTGNVTTINVHHEETLGDVQPPGSGANRVFEEFVITIAVDEPTNFKIDNVWNGTGSVFGGAGAFNGLTVTSLELPGNLVSLLYDDTSLVDHSGVLQPLDLLGPSGFLYTFRGFFSVADPVDSAHSVGDFTITLSPVPEPSSALLLGLGVFGTLCGAAARKRASSLRTPTSDCSA